MEYLKTIFYLRIDISLFYVSIFKRQLKTRRKSNCHGIMQQVWHDSDFSFQVCVEKNCSGKAVKCQYSG